MSAAKGDGKLWFTARTVYEHDETGDGLFEERIVLIRAAGFEDALERAEAEARAYAEAVSCVYTGYVSVFELVDEELDDGAEVFSLMRDSDLSAEEYIDRFFTTGDERSDDEDGDEELQS
jgi:hypothetical protein